MNDQFSNLVAKVLANEASAEERNQLREYLQSDADQQLVYEQLKEYWNADVRLSSAPISDFEATLLQNLSSENKRLSKGRTKRLTTLLRISSVAASLFFVISCYLYFIYQPEGSHLLTYAAQNDPLEYLLSDGSRIKVNKNSSVTIDESFGRKFRKVKLEGEAYFEVKHDAVRPFVVQTAGTSVTVLGTRFNVREETDKVITTLVEGSVQFAAGDCDKILEPGEELCYNVSSGKYNLYATDIQLSTAWVTGRYTYHNLKFADLLQKLSYIYKIPIEISGSAESFGKVVSASFLYDEPLPDILSALESELNFSFSQSAGKIIISPPQ